MRTLLTIIFVFFFFGNLFSQQTTWEKKYPNGPDRYKDIFAIDFDTLVACGSNGEIWRTTNGGTNWALTAKVSDDQLDDIVFIGAKGWIAGGYGVYYSGDYGRSWTKVFTSSSSSLQSVDFINDTEGWVCGSQGYLLHTTDGGATWSEGNIPVSHWSTWFFGIDFLDSQHGFAVGSNYTYASTTNGGTTWQVSEGDEEGGHYYFDIKFYNNTYGLIVGHNKILRTTDGGVTWNDNVSVNGDILNKYIYDISWGKYGDVFISANSGLVGISSDYGLTWTETVVNSSAFLYGIAAKGDPPEDIWVAGNNALIYNSTDGGSNWSLQTKTLPVNGALRSVSFFDENRGIAVGDNGAAIETTDGGDTWTTISGISTSEVLWDIGFHTSQVDPNYGIIVGDGGVYFTTTDRGLHWQSGNTGLFNRLRAVSAGPSGLAYAISDGGYGYAWRFAEILWDSQRLTYELYDVAKLDAGDALAVGVDGIIYTTTDHGVLWSQKSVTGIPRGNSAAQLNAICFPNANIGYIGDSDEKVYKTINGGDTWSEISWPANMNQSYYINDIFFIDPLHGWVSMDGGEIMYTSDGGTTWSVEQKLTNNDIYKIHTSGGKYIWAVGASGTILKGTLNLTKPSPALVSFPLSGDVDIDVTSQLYWRQGAGPDPTNYRLYLGTDGGGTTRPTNIVNGAVLNGSTTSYIPTSDFNANTTYYWQIVPYNANGDADNCPIWSFTTRKSVYYGGGGSTAPGYFFASSLPGGNGAPSQPTYNWNDPQANGHTLITNWTGDSDDGYSGPISIGFSFPFFGTYYTSLYIGTNGVVTFGSGYSGTGSNASIPSTNAPNNMLAALLMDLFVNSSNGNSGVYYYSTSNKFIVTWYYLSPKGSNDYITFQLILEPSGYISFQYNSNNSTLPLPSAIANDALIGIENASGTIGLQYRNDGTGGPIFGTASSPKGNGGTKQDGDNAVAFDDDENGLAPVELTSFIANVNESDVKLLWQTSTEVNNYGFEIQRSTSSENSEWTTIGFVEGCGNSNSPKKYSFEDKNLPCGAYTYRLKQIDLDGTFEYSESIEVEINVAYDFKLMQNYPNPFNPTTTISYSLPAPSGTKTYKNVTLRIFNSLGERVATLVNKEQSAGGYTVRFDAKDLPSGIYFYELRADGFRDVKKMLLMK
jgi:photosystem II stability/assembly factor-like uncharacterized protein